MNLFSYMTNVCLPWETAKLFSKVVILFCIILNNVPEFLSVAFTLFKSIGYYQFYSFLLFQLVYSVSLLFWFSYPRWLMILSFFHVLSSVCISNEITLKLFFCLFISLSFFFSGKISLNIRIEVYFQIYIFQIVSSSQWHSFHFWQCLWRA